MIDREESLRLHSGAYVEGYERRPISRIARLVPRMHLVAREELIDIACGNGMLLPLVHDKVSAYHGVDFSQDFIDVARRRAAANGITNFAFHCEDVVDFARLHPERFGVATALDFSEHIDDADFVTIFTAVRGAMKPGGRLYIHTPNLRFLPELLKQWGIVRQFPQHIAVRDAEHLLRLLEACGFARGDMRIEQLAHYNVLRFAHPLRKLPVVGRYFVARLFIECRK